MTNHSSDPFRFLISCSTLYNMNRCTYILEIIFNKNESFVDVVRLFGNIRKFNQFFMLQMHLFLSNFFISLSWIFKKLFSFVLSILQYYSVNCFVHPFICSNKKQYLHRKICINFLPEPPCYACDLYLNLKLLELSNENTHFMTSISAS